MMALDAGLMSEMVGGNCEIGGLIRRLSMKTVLSPVARSVPAKARVWVAAEATKVVV